MQAETEPKPKRRRKRASKRPHGQGTVYKVRADSSTWSISWREHGRRRYSHGFMTEELARIALAGIVNEVQRGRAGLPPDPTLVPTLGELAKPWLERREKTHRSWRDDRSRWDTHLAPAFGKMRPHEVDQAAIRRFVEDKRLKINPATVQRCIALLSTFYTHLVEEKKVQANPVRDLPRATRRLYRPTYDPRDTPFLEKIDHVRRVYQALRADGEETAIAVAYAVGALAGLRPGEIVALDWSSVDLEARLLRVRCQARHGRLGPVKDDEARDVPIQDALVPILSAWELRTGGTGLVTPPAVAGRGRRSKTGHAYLKNATLNGNVREALKACKLPEMSWYCATRHTYASQWVLAGGSLEKLAKTLGHSMTEVTTRYAHLRGDLFGAADRGLLAVDLSAKGGRVVGRVGSQLVNGEEKQPAKKSRKVLKTK